MNRIRYGKYGNNLLRSVKLFYHPTNGAQYYIVLNENTLEFEIYDVMAGNCGPAATGMAVNKHQLRIKAKNVIESLGADTGIVESRRR